MVTPQEMRSVGQLPVTLTKYQGKSTEKKIYLAPAFAVLLFGSDVMVGACGVAGHHGEEDLVKPSCSRFDV